MNENLSKATNYLSKKIREEHSPEVGIVLGTGLSELVNLIDDAVAIPYSEIPGFVEPTAPSHAGKLISGTINSVPVCVMQGRFHYYEGYSMEDVTFPVRVLNAVGCRILILTNAAGSLNEKMAPGDIVCLKDHINFMGTNPLIGKNEETQGERFPSLHEPYDTTLIDKVMNIADEKGIKVQQGVYTAVTGPSLETRAECRMFANLGSDLVGMSTVPETIVAKHAGMKVLAFSIVTNYGNIFHSNSHTQEEIRANAGKAQKSLAILINEIIKDCRTR
ncbi:MAG: purine-nucleoside phosphorylase [Candidatus Cloacimonetes bacterium]|nr:purine-nucleoside phosphorylase [Candidatus Cloacimonadota bacterium]